MLYLKTYSPEIFNRLKVKSTLELPLELQEQELVVRDFNEVDAGIEICFIQPLPSEDDCPKWAINKKPHHQWSRV